MRSYSCCGCRRAMIRINKRAGIPPSRFSHLLKSMRPYFSSRLVADSQAHFPTYAEPLNGSAPHLNDALKEGEIMPDFITHVIPAGSPGASKTALALVLVLKATTI